MVQGLALLPHSTKEDVGACVCFFHTGTNKTTG